MNEEMAQAAAEARKLLTRSELIAFDYLCEIYPSQSDTHRLMLDLAERGCHRFSARRTKIDRKLADLGFRIVTRRAGKPGAKTHMYSITYESSPEPVVNFEGNQGILPLERHGTHHPERASVDYGANL